MTKGLTRPAWMWVIAFILPLSAAAPTATEERAAREERGASATATRFLAAPGEPLTEYRAFRRMHARCDRFDQEGWVDAWTELDANGFRYEIVSERGSEYVRNKVLKALLKREQELIARGDDDRSTFTEDNYVFAAETEGPEGTRYVTIKPKRKEVTLVEGRMVLSPDGADLLRVEGKLAKNPSFWTSLVNIVRHFARVDGVRVPTSTESVAKVKFAGRSQLQVVYEYESINGRPVSSAGRQTLAAATTR